jgi:hypothetical protein
VRRRQDPHVDLDLVGGAEPGDAPRLQDAQQRSLGAQRQLADLVEQHAASGGRLEHTLAHLHGAGEGAALVTEQRGLHHLPRQGAAVHAQQRSRRARSRGVHQPRQHLLAGAGLALDEHRQRRPAEPSRQLRHRTDRGALQDRCAGAARGRRQRARWICCGQADRRLRRRGARGGERDVDERVGGAAAGGECGHAAPQPRVAGRLRERPCPVHRCGAAALDQEHLHRLGPVEAGDVDRSEVRPHRRPEAAHAVRRSFQGTQHQQRGQAGEVARADELPLQRSGEGVVCQERALALLRTAEDVERHGDAAQLHLVAGTQHRAITAGATHRRSVGGAEVLHGDLVALEREASVEAREAGVVHRHVRRRPPSHRDRSARKQRHRSCPVAVVDDEGDPAAGACPRAGSIRIHAGGVCRGLDRSLHGQLAGAGADAGAGCRAAHAR